MTVDRTGISQKAIEASFIKKVSEIVRTGLVTYPPLGAEAQENVMKIAWELGSLSLRYDKKYRNQTKGDYKYHTGGFFKDKVINAWHEHYQNYLERLKGHYQRELRSAIEAYVLSPSGENENYWSLKEEDWQGLLAPRPQPPSPEYSPRWRRVSRPMPCCT